MTPPAHAKPDTWTTHRLLRWMTDAFTRSGLDSPRLFAELLMAHVLGCDRLKLYMEADRPAAELERGALRDLVGRALKHEPVQYLVGEAWFYGLPFRVDRRVLIPRPSSETIVDQLLRHSRAEPGFGGEGVCIGDVCTGSGCLAVTLVKNLPGARGLATDISGPALEVARENAKKHKVADRVEFLQGDLLEPLLDHPAARGLHYLIANPPYIPDAEWESVAANVRDYEPHGALRGGADGLTFVRPLVEKGPQFLRAGGLLMVEIATATAGAVLELARGHAMLESPRIEPDGDGLARVLIARRRN